MKYLLIRHQCFDHGESSWLLYLRRDGGILPCEYKIEGKCLRLLSKFGAIMDEGFKSQMLKAADVLIKFRFYHLIN